MGGATDDQDADEGGEESRKIDVDEWLQVIIDALGSEYGWTVEHIFSRFPQEVEILVRRIRERRAADDDAELLRMITAVQTQNMEDGGKSVINTVLARHKHKRREPKVTQESIARELALANALLRR